MRNRDTRAQIFRRSASREKSIFASGKASRTGRRAPPGHGFTRVHARANSLMKKAFSPMRTRHRARHVGGCSPSSLIRQVSPVADTSAPARQAGAMSKSYSPTSRFLPRPAFSLHRSRRMMTSTRRGLPRGGGMYASKAPITRRRRRRVRRAEAVASVLGAAYCC